MTSWLILTTLEISALTVLVIAMRPILLRLLGAKASYLLWLLIPLAVLMPALPIPSLLDLIPLSEPGSVYPHYDNYPLVDQSANSPALTSLWIIGLGISLFWKGLGYLRLRRRLAGTSVQLNRRILSHTARQPLADFTGNLYSTSLPMAPFVMGYANPAIYLPDGFEEKFSPAQQQWIIEHELTHIRRKDLWVLLVAEIIRVVFWFNPLIHLAVRMLRRDQELACDQDLLGHATTKQRIEYGETLLRSQTQTRHPTIVTFFKSHQERYKMIARHKSSFSRTITSYIFICLVGSVVLTTPPYLRASVLDEKPITLNFQQIDANKLFTLMGSYLGLKFEGIAQLENEKIDVSVTNVTAREALDMILSCRGFQFAEKPNATITIVPKQNHRTQPRCD